MVPVYDHGRTIGAVIAGLRAFGLPCTIVDDGSGAQCARELVRLAAEVQGVTLLRLPANRGKGAAVALGLRQARLAGYSHALQIDADGQHSLASIPEFLAAAHADPEALVCGCPIFDGSIPASRRYGRQLTRLWVNINTLSTDIPDAMCGFRIYPVILADELMKAETVGERMNFDVEILVRLRWRGVRMHWIDTPVVYPQGGVSHFRLFRDNVLISVMHARLFAGMLLRLPSWLMQRCH